MKPDPVLLKALSRKVCPQHLFAHLQSREGAGHASIFLLTQLLLYTCAKGGVESEEIGFCGVMIHTSR